MDRIGTYLAMGGYAAYVWSALAVAAVVMIGQVVLTLRTLRRREAAGSNCWCENRWSFRGRTR